MGGPLHMKYSNILLWSHKSRFKIWITSEQWVLSNGVDGGLSGGSGVLRPGSEEPHRRERKFEYDAVSGTEIFQL